MVRPKRTTLITALCAAFLIGLVLGHNLWQVDLALVGCAALLLWLTHGQRFTLLAIVILGAVVGVYRGHQSLLTNATLEQYFDQKVTIIGRLVDDPTHNEKGHLQYTLTTTSIDDQPVKARVKVRSHYAFAQRDFLVRVNGKLERNNYGSQPAEIGFATVEVLSREQGWLEQIRQRFLAGMRTALPEPMASLGLGLLVGVRALVPKPLQDQLAKVGLSHIVAVSGYNLTIIVEAVRKTLGRYSKFVGAAACLWLIAGFALLTGMSASIIRAAVVSTLIIVTSYYGHQIKPLVLIGLAAAGTAAFNPDYMFRDLGWQLSFLAFFGILVLAPAIERRLVKKSSALKTMMIQSLSAQIMTFPLIMLTFGQFSIAAPLANLLVVPMVPLAMFLSFIAALAGIFWGQLAGWISLPAQLMLRWILELTSWLSNLDQASIAVKSSLSTTLVIYTLVLLSLLVSLAASRRIDQSGIKPEV